MAGRQDRTGRTGLSCIESKFFDISHYTYCFMILGEPDSCSPRRLRGRAGVGEGEGDSEGARECIAYVYALKHEFGLRHPRENALASNCPREQLS